MVVTVIVEQRVNAELKMNGFFELFITFKVLWDLGEAIASPQATFKFPGKMFNSVVLAKIHKFIRTHVDVEHLQSLEYIKTVYGFGKNTSFSF